MHVREELRHRIEQYTGKPLFNVLAVQWVCRGSGLVIASGYGGLGKQA